MCIRDRDQTYRLWRDFGQANRLDFGGPAAQANMEQRARRFADKFHLTEGSPAPALREENLDAETRREFFAWQFMKAWHYANHLTNFEHHYNRAFVEAKDETIKARKLFYEAETLHLKNADPRALKKYQHPDALKAWREKVLLGNKEFRRDPFIQEQTYEIQLKYLDLYTEQNGNALTPQSVGLVLGAMPVPLGGGVCPAGLADWLAPRKFQPDKGKSWQLDLDWGNPLLGGPFDGTDSEGYPLIEEHTRMAVLRRLYPALFASMPTSQTPPGPSPSGPNP